MNELSWAVRRLTRSAGFSGVFVAILGVTLGISLTITTVARATIGAALPFEDADRLYSVFESNAGQQIPRMASSYAAVGDWGERAEAFEAIGAVRPQLNLTLEMPDRVARISGAIVTRSMFDVLRLSPMLGRAFSEEEDAPNSGITAVVLSHDTWRDRFGEDPDLVGRSIVINGSSWTVVGVMPEDATLAPHATSEVDVWLPIGMAAVLVRPPVYDSRLFRMFAVIGRLRPDAALTDIDRDVGVVTTGLAEDHPDSHGGWAWQAELLRDRVLLGVSTPIRALFVGGLLLLTVAVVNLLALYVLRIRTQQGNLATRLAVGATPEDLMRLSLAELGVLGLASGAVGVGVSSVAVRLVPLWFPIDLPPHVEVAFGWGLATTGVAVAVAALLLVGLAGMSVAMRGLERTAAAGGRIVGSSSGSSRLSQSSLTAQIALSTFLAIGSAIAVKSFVHLANSDPGVDPERLTALRVDVPAELRNADAVVATADDIVRSLAEIPSVQDAFLWSPHVPAEATWYTRVRLQDRPDVPEAELPTVRFHTVGPGSVTGLGLSLAAGRDFTQEDRDTGRRVMLVSASAARAWWGGESAAVGRILQRWSHEEWSEVVGVVEDAPLSGRQGDGSDIFTDVYFLFGQDEQRDLVFLARAQPGTRLDEEALRTAVGAAAPDLPPYDVRAMETRLDDQDALTRSSALLSSVFALSAIILAALGLYSALSFVVGRKRREIGLRQALGATPGRVVRELLRGGSAAVVLGTVMGVLIAWYGLPTIDTTLFVVGAHDVPSYVAATALLLAAALVAQLWPSLRALRATPGESLKDD